MARFYDTANETDLKRVEVLLKENGIVYTLRTLNNEAVLLHEFEVAEEDIAAAEKTLCQTCMPA
ncbi:MAG: hypothetical protein M0T70_16345 [Geobacteraceae bacterium]|nr:hypothetical protein [Geobacteraceae bacterium]